MTSLKFATIAATLALAAPAFAQDAPATDPNAGAPAAPTAAPTTGGATMAGPEKKMGVGVDVAGILPLGDYSNGASFGIGALARFEYAVNPMLSATVRAGYIYNLGTPDGEGVSFIPVLVGATYHVGPPGLFVFGEVGITNIRVSIDTMGVSASDSSTKFSFGAGVGYQKEKIKARVGFFMPGSEDNGNGGSTTLYGIMGSVGYDFAAF